MEPDCYQIEVLHFVNPHLIWVEVVPMDAKNADFKFEQVGIYGIMPMEVTIDMVEGCVKGQESLEWTPAICKVMAQIFSSATEVWFRPVFIDRSSSIFDSNIHKYGEITVKTNGTTKDLSKLLTKSCFAHHDTKAFLNAFASSNLNTKLTPAETKDVVKILERTTPKDAKKRWEKSFNSHVTVTKAAQNLENALTKSNLSRHNRNLAMLKDKNVDDVMKEKYKDFELCKNADEESAGRGVSSKQKIVQPPTKNSDNLINNLVNTKDLLLKLAKRKPVKVDLDENAEKSPEDLKVFEDEAKETVCADVNPGTRPGFNRESSIEPPSSLGEPQNQPRRKPKKKGPKMVIPDYDMKKEVRIAIGPPDIDKKTLPPKVILKTAELQGYGARDGDMEMKIEAAPMKNMLAGLDSDNDVNVKKNNIVKDNVVHGSDGNVDDNSKTMLTDDEKNNLNGRTFCKKLSEKLKILADKQNLNVSAQHLNNSCSSTDSDKPRIPSSILKRQKLLKQMKTDSSNDTTVKDSTSENSKTHVDSDNETTLSQIVERLDIKQEIVTKTAAKVTYVPELETHVNPFKNIDPTISKFVDKLVTPVLMVHTSNKKRIQPVQDLCDVNFNAYIRTVLTRNSIKYPMTLQSVTWFTILRGYSVFMVSPLGSGKTWGYIPAVCRLVTDFYEHDIPDSIGPICIIVCGTTKSVIEVERYCKMFLREGKRVVCSYAGLDDMEVTTALLNGCHVLVCTPSALVRLLNKTDFGVDLKRLSTFVLDDCERLDEVYLNEVKFFQLKIKEMLKARANKELKVQFILASRIWCEFMETLAKKTPNTLICIGSFQECVLYSKLNMSINFIDKKKKIDTVLEFVYSVDAGKRSVIVCRSDEEVELVEKELKGKGFSVFSADNKMTVENLYTLSCNWADYEEPLKGPILVCCDGNLTHLNITNAHYLLHYSLPNLFSMFSRRFAVLTENYPSIFGGDDKVVKIKILLESENTEQLPKIMHFIKRCEQNIPETLDEVCTRVLKEKDLAKAKTLVPLCDNMLGLGECPDFWNCRERHSVIQEFDEPNEWMPKSGLVTFKILHYHTAVKYSVRLIANISKGNVSKYPQTYSSLSLKMGLYYSKDSNRKLHGVPKVGDICAVALKENFFERCQVVKILSNNDKTGQPYLVLVKLIDEEKWETTRDVFLYHMPKELAVVNSHVALVRLATVQPKDKDVTYSDLATSELRHFTEKYDDLYVRGRIVTTIGNSIIVDTLEACQDLTSSKETVLRFNLKEELLKKHAIPNPDHVEKLEKIAPTHVIEKLVVETTVEPATIVREKPRWAFLQKDDFQTVYVTSAENPEAFFVRLEKFDDCLEMLEKDIQKHVTVIEPMKDPQIRDIVLAKFPSTSLYHRARIETLSTTAKCFSVDHGDLADVDLKEIYPIPSKFISVLPFQTIECRLIAVKPPGENWNEYSTNWFSDQCYQGMDFKSLYAKYFNKDHAEMTGGSKYGIVLVDTYGKEDMVINKAMLELNLAGQVDEELDFLNDLNFKIDEAESDDSKSDWEEEYEKFKEKKALMPISDSNNSNGNLIRSVPLANSDEEFDDDRWDVEIDYKELMKPREDKTLPALEPGSVVSNSSKTSDFEVIPKANIVDCEELMKSKEGKTLPAFEQSLVVSNTSKASDFEVIPKAKIIELDSDDLSSSESVSAEKNVTPSPASIEEIKELQTSRRPKLVWRQKVNTISIKIELIGVVKYDLEIETRHLKFSTEILDTDYAFEFDLYGLVDVKNCFHESRGLYIFVRLTKLLKKNWLSLTKEGGLKKWIVYDPDSIEASSSEDEEDLVKDKIKNIVERHRIESESDDEEFMDDVLRY